MSMPISRPAREPLAIVGIGCRFPGGAENPSAFWELLSLGRDAIVDVPEDRWSIRKFYDSNPSKPGKMYVRSGGFLQERVDQFDALFFGISPREAMCMDPQQRLLLEVAWEALEDYGVDPTHLSGSATGVYIGAFTLDNKLMQMSPASRDVIGPHTAISSTMTILSNRLSYIFDFRGPSVSLDTACSSSLVAFHYACQALWQSECSLALAGGVNIMLRPEYPIAMCKGQFLAPDGHCKSFDARADGYARAEGAGIVVLKPLADALRDEDEIYALVRGTGVNQDGRTNGITVPNPDSQEALIRQVCAQADVSPQQIYYVEAHGTGTAVGDPLEARALGAVLGQGRQPEDACLVGSLKANIGHPEAAAGIAGVIKAALCLTRRQIPPLANLEQPNPEIPFEALGLRLPRTLEPIPESLASAYVSINSFGYGGTNAHAILEAPPPAQPGGGTRCENDATRPYMLPLSARSAQALTAQAESYLARVSDDESPPLHDVCYSASLRRGHHAFRAALTADSRMAMIEQLQSLATYGHHADIAMGHVTSEQVAKPVFVFTGMGPQWWGMGRELLQREPIFREMAEACDMMFRRLTGWSILEQMIADEASSRITETQIAQPANLVLQASLVALWRSWGVEPAAIVGHSVGEVTAAYAAGVYDLEDAVQVSYHRSRLQQRAAGKGKMLAVGLTMEEANVVVADYDGQVSIAAANSPSAVTLAGEAKALEDIAAWLATKGLFHRFLQVEVPYHSHYMEPLKPALREALRNLRTRPPRIPLYSTVTGRIVDEAMYDANYWCHNIREPVRFAEALQCLMADGYQLFLEVGPHPVLSTSIKECLLRQGIQGEVCASLHRKQPEQQAMMKALGTLYTAGYAVDWRQLYPAGGRYVKLPTYPWQRETYWRETEQAHHDRLGEPEHVLLGNRVSAPTPSWESVLSENFLPYLRDHKIEGLVVLPGAAYVEAGLAIHQSTSEQASWRLDNLQFHKALVVDEGDEPVLHLTYDEETHAYAIYSRPRDDHAAWTQHATGQLSLIQPCARGRIPLESIQRRCDEVVDIDMLYAQLGARGLQYGPYFQAVRRLQRQRGEVLAQIKGHEELQGSEDRYALHPTLLDACFQSLIATLDAGSGDGAMNVYVPVRIRQFRFYHSPQGRFWSHGRLTKQTASVMEGDITLCDDNGNILAEVRGMRCQALTAKKQQFIEDLDQWLYAYAWQQSELETEAVSPGHWLVFMDQSGVGEQVVAQLHDAGVQACILVEAGETYNRDSATHFRLRPNHQADLQQLLEVVDVGACQGIVYLWGLNADADDGDPMGTQDVITCLHLIQALDRVGAEASPRLYLATRGAQQVFEDEPKVALAQTALVGLARVAFNEHPALRCTLVDLPPDNDTVGIPMLVEELLAESSEDDVALRRGERYVHRMMRNPLPALASESQELVEVPSDTPFSLDVDTPGVIDSLGFRATQRQEPGPEEVEIAIYATALNLQDVLKVERRVSGDELAQTFSGSGLGLEVSGIIARVGSAVEGLRVGDSVVAILTSNFSTYATLPAKAVFAVPKPPHISHEEAAALPLAFAIAYYGLRDIARLQPGTRVLIDSGVSAIALAAIQIARWIGAEIFVATDQVAHQEVFRSLGAYPIMTDGALDMAERIMEATDDQGVDVVLNTALGDNASFSLDVLVPFGCFVDVSPSHTSPNRRGFEGGPRDNLTVASLNLDRMMATHPEQFQQLLNNVWEWMRTQNFEPLPVSIYPATAVADAFHAMGKRLHLGKIVVSMRQEEQVPVRPLILEKPLFAPDATYLISGGFGGFGLELAKWMATQGVRHLVLVGRRGAASPEAQQTVESLERMGVQVYAAAADMTQEVQVRRMMAAITDAMPPLKGVIHAAAVLDDAPLLALDAERFANVMAPKALGAWLLHRHTRCAPLDYFVLFSSVSALIGNARQGNYVAANTFLDMLAHYRRSQGLPATSINWGVLTDVGMASASEEVAQHLELMGIKAFAASQAMEAFAQVLQWNPVQIGVMNVDWQRWGQFEPTGGRSPRFAHLVAEGGKAQANEVANEVRHNLLAMAPEDRSEMIVLLLAEQVAETLRLPSEKVPLYHPLPDIGIDSLMAVELQTAMSIKFGVEISTLELMKGNTITQMGEQVLVKMGMTGDVMSSASTCEGPETPRVIEQVDTLSETEVDHLLDKLIAQEESS